MARKTNFEIFQEVDPLLKELREEQKLEPIKWWKAVTIDDQAVVFWWDYVEPPTMQDVCDTTEWYPEEIECWGKCSEKENEEIRRLKLPKDEVNEY
jgi:hypothetical protein